jgi:chromosome segregation ATPase
MAIMKKDVNFGMFVLIIATLFVFAGFTSYYQSTFENLTSEYRIKLSELGLVTENLQEEKVKLNQTSLQLKIKAEREQDLSNKYDDMRGIKEQLEVDKAALESDLAATKSDLATTSAELSTTKDSLVEKTAALSSALAEVDSLKSERDSLKAQKDSLQEQLDNYVCG